MILLKSRSQKAPSKSLWIHADLRRDDMNTDTDINKKPPKASKRPKISLKSGAAHSVFWQLWLRVQDPGLACLYPQISSSLSLHFTHIYIIAAFSVSPLSACMFPHADEIMALISFQLLKGHLEDIPEQILRSCSKPVVRPCGFQQLRTVNLMLQQGHQS